MNERDFNEFASSEENKAVQIIKADISGHKFELDEEELEKLLMKEEIRERNVVIVSVAGAFRKGKSFLLDFFLRYLEAKYKKKDINNWLGSNDVPLEGFSWKGGSDRVTAGILMWSEIFLGRTSNGYEVAIILLDTQGAFDSDSTVCDCATIFSLSTMVSSVQVYNLSQNIQEDDLQHLQLFTEYGRLALADSGRVPFQKLLFLVRDWSFPYEADYGLTGGKQILSKRLEINKNQHSELQYLRRHIKACFSDISCYLLPHPGLNVATNPNFIGKLNDIQPEFLNYIEQLAPLLLAPENLILKKISGQCIKVKELFLYFKSYTKIFCGNELPEPKSMLIATAEANNLATLATAKENYVISMEGFCGGNMPYMKNILIEEEHKKQKLLAINFFINKKKMGGEELAEKYQLQLNIDLEKMCLYYKEHNESKNVFKAAKTPAVLMTVAIITYLLSCTFAIIGLNTISSLWNIFTAIAIITLTTWSYFRYNGDNLDITNLIDITAERIWELILGPLFLSITELSQNNIENKLITAGQNIEQINNPNEVKPTTSL